MKKFFAVLGLSILTLGSFAQKIGYVDTEYILNNIPEYKSKQSQLDEISVGWQKEIEAKYAEIDKMYKAFQAEQVLLTEDMRRKREDDIVKKEKEAKDLQKQRFGYEGDLYKKRQELVKPIQDKVFNAIKDIANSKSYAIIFDKANSLTMLYTNTKYDISNEVLESLGIKMNPDEPKEKK
ncbi:MAG: OmpH family outer membrane protein [Bacteroidia bacterium]|nr:OmpH family outer membrane protein [Bacteroidia bacterium]